MILLVVVGWFSVLHLLENMEMENENKCPLLSLEGLSYYLLIGYIKIVLD